METTEKRGKVIVVDKHVDKRLKGIQPRCHWGFNLSHARKHNIVTCKDNEVLYAVGKKLVMFDSSEPKATVIHLAFVEVISIGMFSISSCRKYLTVAAKIAPLRERRANLITYELETLNDVPKRPVIMDFMSSSTENEYINFTCISFSSDSSILAAATNLHTVGVLVYDRASGALQHQIITKDLILSVSFNPTDNSRLCTTGSNDLFQFWRCTQRLLNAIPIAGVKRASQSYTCHTWVTEHQVVAGTDAGYLALVHGTDLQAGSKFAFGGPNQPDREEGGVCHLISRNDIIIAVSQSNCLGIFEVRPAGTVTGGQGIIYTLVALARLRLASLTEIAAVQWRLPTSSSSYEVVISTPQTLCAVDTKAADYRMSVVEATSQATAKTGRSSVLSTNPFTDTAMVEWIDIKADEILLTQHEGRIHSMSLATRMSTFVTASDDDTVRVWDFNKPNTPGQLAESFTERSTELPHSIHMHPSGNYVAFGCEDDVREFHITDSKFELVRKLSTKAPFTGPGGVPFVNSQFVSLVRYCHGGHLLAAVTGRLAQIFHMYSLEFSSTDLAGFPSRVMALTDHKAPIIDLVFSADDSKVFTSAADGTVYSWFTFGSSRDGEFIAKGSTAMKIAVSCQSGPEGYIISSFLPSDHANHHANTTMGKKMARNMHSSDFRKRQQDHGASRGGDTGKRFSVGTGPNASAMQGARLKSPLDGTSADEGGKNFLVVWRGNVSSSGEVVMLDAPLTALTFGRMDGHSAHRDEFVVMGFADGRVVVSMLPLPLRVFNSKATIHSTHISSHFNHQNDSDVIIAGVAAGGASMGFASTSGPPSIDGGPSRADADPHSSHGRGPMGSFTGNGNGGDGIANGDEERVLDLTQCAKLHLHETEVTEVAVAASGYWFFTAGADGVVFMMSTSMRARDFYDVPEALALENSFVVTEKSNLQALRSRMDDVDTIITEAFRDNERKMNKLKEQMTTTVATLENRMKREVQKRDDIILRGRDEHAKQQRMLNEEKRTVEKKLTDEIVELESIYERKLTQESLYLDRMRQAFDEVVVHSRMDVKDEQAKAQVRELKLAELQQEALQEGEKQKALVLAYVNYVKQRNDEILTAMEDSQEAERTRLKEEVQAVKASNAEVLAQAREEVVLLSRNNKQLQELLLSREDEALRARSDFEQANTKIHRLEISLQNATMELKARNISSEKWELKAGEYHQQIDDLERVRKSLTSQLHLVRKELAPKEQKLVQASEKLQEIGREYDQAKFAIADKEQALSHKSESLHLLQKQLRELRNTCTQKDACLRRAAKILEEYNRSLQQAMFNSYKRTVSTAASKDSLLLTEGGGATNPLVTGDPAVSTKGRGKSRIASRAGTAIGSSGPDDSKSEVVEVIARSEGMETSLRRLHDILHPYLITHETDSTIKDEVDAGFEERERHIQLLHRNVTGLKSSLELTNQVAATKVKHHLTDNQHLLKEVNNLRHEVRLLSMENQRLIAQIEFTDVRRKDRLATSASLDGSTASLPSAPSTAGPTAREMRSDQNRLIGNMLSMSRQWGDSDSPSVFSPDDRIMLDLGGDMGESLMKSSKGRTESESPAKSIKGGRENKPPLVPSASLSLPRKQNAISASDSRLEGAYGDSGGASTTGSSEGFQGIQKLKTGSMSAMSKSQPLPLVVTDDISTSSSPVAHQTAEDKIAAIFRDNEKLLGIAKGSSSKHPNHNQQEPEGILQSYLTTLEKAALDREQSKQRARSTDNSSRRIDTKRVFEVKTLPSIQPTLPSPKAAKRK